MIRRFFTIIPFLALVLSGCMTVQIGGIGGDGVRGAGDVVSQSFQTGNFTAVDIRGVYRVFYRQSGEPSVTVEMQENLFEYLQVSVNDGTLLIDSDRDFNTTDANRPRVYIYAPQLTGATFSLAVSASEWDTIYAQSFFINAEGAANINIPLEVETLDINASGAVNLQLSGNAENASINVEGAVNVSANNLQTRNASIVLTGAGNVDIACSDTLDVVLDGVGRVRYTGDPVVNQSIFGLGTVRRN